MQLVYVGYVLFRNRSLELTEAGADEWWGAGPKGTGNNFAASSLVIKYLNHPLFVRAAAYSDLTNIYKVKIDKTTVGYVITIDGGDTSAGYTAKLLIRRVGKVFALKQRTVRDGVAPKEWWVATTFSDPFQM